LKFLALGFYKDGAPIALAFQNVALPVPEPSTLGLLAVGITAFIVRRRRSSGA